MLLDDFHSCPDSFASFHTLSLSVHFLDHRFLFVCELILRVGLSYCSVLFHLTFTLRNSLPFYPCSMVSMEIMPVSIHPLDQINFFNLAEVCSDFTPDHSDNCCFLVLLIDNCLYMALPCCLLFINDFHKDFFSCYLHTFIFRFV